MFSVVMLIIGKHIMKNTVATLLNQQVQCVLATLGDKELALHLMAYAISTDLDKIYLASLENTQKEKRYVLTPMSPVFGITVQEIMTIIQLA